MTKYGKEEKFYGKCLNCHEDLMGPDIIQESINFGIMKGWIFVIRCAKCDHIIGTTH